MGLSRKSSKGRYEAVLAVLRALFCRSDELQLISVELQMKTVGNSLVFSGLHQKSL